MNKVIFWLFTLSLAFPALGVAAAPTPAKVQITATKKRGDTVRPKTSGNGAEAKRTEQASYALVLKNISTGDLANLTVDYILFVERPKLGEKKTQPAFVERVTGSKPVATLTRQAPQTVNTDEVSLTTENLSGNYIFSDGGRVKAEDTIAGVWVRVSQDGQVIGEYAAPPSITKQAWDKK